MYRLFRPIQGLGIQQRRSVWVGSPKLGLDIQQGTIVWVGLPKLGLDECWTGVIIL